MVRCAFRANDAGSVIPNQHLAHLPPRRRKSCSLGHPVPRRKCPFTASKAPSFLALFFLDLSKIRTTDGEHGTNLAGRGSLVRLMLALVTTANYAEYHWTRGLK